MKPLKFYISSLDDNNELKNFVSSDYDEYTNQLNKNLNSVFIHIGLKSLESDFVKKILTEFSNSKIYSSASFHILSEIDFANKPKYKFTFEKYTLFSSNLINSENAENFEEILDANDIKKINLEFGNTLINNVPEFSVRTINGLKGAGYSKVGELFDLKHKDFLKMQNLGLKSVYEIEEYLKKKNYLEGNSEPEDLDLSEPENLCFIDQIDNLKNNLLTQRLFEAFSRRLGLYKKQITLEEAGKLMGITREGVRQLAFAARRKILKTKIVSELDDRITSIRSGMSIPLRPEDLLFHDPVYFKGLQDKPWIIPNFLRMFIGKTKNKLELLSDNLFITDLGNTNLQVSVSAIEHYIETNTLSSMDEFEDIIEQHIDFSAKELRGYVTNYIKKKYLFTFNHDGQLIIDKDQKNRHETVQHIFDALNQSETPLRKEDLIKQILSKGFSKNTRTIENLLTKLDECYLFNKGTYGLRKHLFLSDNEIALMSNYLLDYVNANTSKEQWFSNEFAEIIQKEKNGDIENFIKNNEIDFDKTSFLTKVKKLTHYEISVGLQISKFLKYLGKNTFVTIKSTNRIINYKKLVEDILEQSDVPMSLKEIVKKAPVLGQKSTFQLHNRGRLIPFRDDNLLSEKRRITESTKWGLLDKHLNLNNNKLNQIINEMKFIFVNKDSSLNFEDTRSMIRRNELLRKFYGNINLLFLLCERSAFFMVHDNQLFWTQSNNFEFNTTTYAIKRAVLAIPSEGLSRDDALKISQSFIKTKFPQNYLSYMSNYECLYDEKALRFFQGDKVEIE